jgi:hypothetical protein
MALLRVLILLPVALSLAARAGCEDAGVTVRAATDQRTVAVGDTFRLNIDFAWKDGVSVKPLAVGETLGKFAVRDIAYGPVSAADSSSSRRISLLLSVFETGKLDVPPVSLIYMDRDGNAGRVESEPVGIEVASVLPADASDIKDIKAPIQVPKRWRDLIGSWALLVGLAVAASASVLMSVKRREEVEAAVRRIWMKITGPVIRLVRWILMRLSLVGRDEYGGPAFDSRIAEPYLTPEQAALKEFDRIDALGLVEQGNSMELYTLVSEAVRRYLERRFRILAMESPISYTMAGLRKRRLSSEALVLIEQVLEETDLVKFARLKTATRSADTLTARGRQLVDATGDRAERVTEGVSG